MPARSPNPKDTIRIIDQLVNLGLLDKRTFKHMHHFGGSLTTFRRYCSTIGSFQHDSENYRLHEKLQNLLDSRSSRHNSRL
jgi:hypothetical protein